MNDTARIYVMDVRALTPSMYREIYGLNYRDAGCMQPPLRRARSGLRPATIAFLIEDCIVLAYVLHHPISSTERWMEDRPSSVCVEQSWTRAAYRHRGYNRLCMSALHKHLGKKHRRVV